MSETDGDFDGQSDVETEDSPVVDQSSVIRAQETKIKELESRIGRLVQESGQERAKIENDYRAWGDNLVTYYTEEIDKYKKIIADLENQLVNELPDEGAKRVLQQRNEREREDEERRRQRAQEQQTYATQLANAKRQAAATFGLDEDDLATVTDINQVWAVAGRKSQEKLKEELKRELVPTPDPDKEREREVEEERRNARTPSNSTPPTREARTPTRSNVETELEELRKKFKRAQALRKLPEAMSIMRQIKALEQSLTE